MFTVSLQQETLCGSNKQSDRNGETNRNGAANRNGAIDRFFGS